MLSFHFFPHLFIRGFTQHLAIEHPTLGQTPYSVLEFKETETDYQMVTAVMKATDKLRVNKAGLQKSPCQERKLSELLAHLGTHEAAVASTPALLGIHEARHFFSHEGRRSYFLYMSGDS